MYVTRYAMGFALLLALGGCASHTPPAREGRPDVVEAANGLRLGFRCERLPSPEGPSLSLVVSLFNQTDRSLTVRQPAGGNLYIYSRQRGEWAWRVPPPASYELAPLVTIPPQSEYEYRFSEPIPAVVCEYYCVYVLVDESSTDWAGTLVSPTILYSPGMANED